MPTLSEVAREVATALALEARAALERSGLTAMIAERGRSLSRAIVAAALDVEPGDGTLVVRARLEERAHDPGEATAPAIVLQVDVGAPTSARVRRAPPRARNGAPTRRGARRA